MKDRATIVCRRDGQILLVARDRARWALPGGTVRKSEAPVQAARRELQEETQMVAGSLQYLFAFGGLSKRHHVFVFDVPEQAWPRPDNEIEQCRWVHPGRIATMSTSVPTREIVTMIYQRRWREWDIDPLMDLPLWR
ncbi:NUDIX hydrolase [Paraburkholderia tropica]|nr:NUDIX hydrolase [Paraburkholderia tropica]